MNKEKSCGCIILKDGKVLLISSKDDDGKLFWSFGEPHLFYQHIIDIKL